MEMVMDEEKEEEGRGHGRGRRRKKGEIGDGVRELARNKEE